MAFSRLKPVGKLARAMPSFKRPLLLVDVMVGIAANDILSNHTSLTPPMRASLFYAAKQRVLLFRPYVMKSAEFLSECGRAKRFFSQNNSKLNEWTNF